MGKPTVFIRLSGCNLSCDFCDTKYHVAGKVMSYDEIERNTLFKCTVENVADRSIMNACFVMQEEYKDLENSFLDFATSKGIIGIKGHRSVGGFRASIYNALTIESVLALVETMQDFEKKV